MTYITPIAWPVTVADQGFFRGGDFGNPTELRGSGLTGEFYAFVNWIDVGIISNV